MIITFSYLVHIYIIHGAQKIFFHKIAVFHVTFVLRAKMEIGIVHTVNASTRRPYCGFATPESCVTRIDSENYV